MYGFPKKYDIFQYMETGFLISTMIISGIYATSLAMFLNIITTQKVGVPLMVFFVALYLIWLLMLNVLGEKI